MQSDHSALQSVVKCIGTFQCRECAIKMHHNLKQSFPFMKEIDSFFKHTAHTNAYSSYIVDCMIATCKTLIF